MKPKKDFLFILDEVKAIVYQILPEHMNQPTPDSEWTVRKLLEHMLYEIRCVPDKVMGVQFEATVKKDISRSLGKDPLSTWRVAAIAAREAVHRCDPDAIVYLSYGEITTREYLQDIATDQLIHAWDLAEAIGIHFRINEQLAKEVFERLWLRRVSMAATGQFAKPLRVPSSANYQTRLLALVGRTPNWRKN